jgi:lambda repressor-like predicted transcriptional regulator
MADISLPLPSRKIKPMSGRYGRLEVLRFARSDRDLAFWWCRCDCGAELEVRGHSLRNGNTTSCGCAQKEHAARTGRKNRTHGESTYCIGNGSPEYRTWNAMIARCTNPKNPSWKRYGGRGITVCESWRQSFEQFLADMGRRPSLSYSLERKDNNVGYSPGNCVWATAKEQNNNTRANRIIEHEGTRLTLAQWADKAGMSLQTFHGRLRRGWNMVDALSVSVLPWRSSELALKRRGRRQKRPAETKISAASTEE